MDRERLARLLGMLDSEHDGEVVNAARLAVRMVDLCRRWEGYLSPFEPEFLASVENWNGVLTPKMQAVWNRLIAKVERLTRAAEPA
jgi:hypothetical protein